MQETTQDTSRVTARAPSPEANVSMTPALAMRLAARTAAAREAVVTGNRAGVIEWANDAMAHLTGLPLESLVGKSVTRLLDVFGIEPAVVDFVQANFVAGCRSTVELPVQLPDGRSRWIHLEVDPHRDALGEIGDFVAVASDITALRAAETDRSQPASRHCPPAGPGVVEGEAAASGLSADALRIGEMLAPIGEHITRLAAVDGIEAQDLEDLGELGRAVGLLAQRLHDRAEQPVAPRSALDLAALVREACRTLGNDLPPRCRLDAVADTRLPSAHSHADRLHEILMDLLETARDAVGDSWSTISVTVGATCPGQLLESAVYHHGFVGSVHDEAPRLFIELHDTGVALTPDELSRLRLGLLPAPASPRVSRLLIARALLGELGGDLQVDATVGSGTRLLVLLPTAPAPRS
jgi:PAS domain S-box-containing protein